MVFLLVMLVNCLRVWKGREEESEEERKWVGGDVVGRGRGNEFFK